LTFANEGNSDDLAIMTVLDTIKTVAEKVTGIGRPERDDLQSLIRPRKPATFRFDDDGIVPNHPRWPLIVYRGAIVLRDDLDPAAIIEDVFSRNGWGRSWRDGIYDYVHYHSRVHEVLGAARGTATVEFGGLKGKKLTLKAGDVAVLPAGTGHRRIEASSDYLVVGAYPPSGTYDECTTSEDRNHALKTVRRVPRPRRDPVYGARDGLVGLWKR
jgi:uncharacterized protein YjlB